MISAIYAILQDLPVIISMGKISIISNFLAICFFIIILNRFSSLSKSKLIWKPRITFDGFKNYPEVYNALAIFNQL